METIRSKGQNTKEVWRKSHDSLVFPSAQSQKHFPFFVPTIAEGAYITDLVGRKYLDFTAQNASVGHNHPRIQKAIIESVTHGGMQMKSMVVLAEKLKAVVPLSLSKSLVGLARSGTLAAEYTILMLRKYSARRSICAFQGSYHGNALGSLSLTLDRSEIRRGFHPFISDVVYLPYAYCYRCAFGQEQPSCGFQCLEYVEYVMDTVAHRSEILAWFIEPIQSHGGVVVPPDGYLERINKLCHENQIFLVSDEVVTGLGRTSRMFGFEHWDVDPDIIFLGKPLGHPLPLGAVIGREEIMKNYPSGVDYSVCTAAAIANIEVILEERLMENASRTGNYLMKRLRELQEMYQVIGDVRGKGLLIALELVKNPKKKAATKEARKIHLQAYRNGLLLMLGGTYLQCMRLAPPLNITTDQIDEAISILDKAFRSLYS